MSANNTKQINSNSQQTRHNNQLPQTPMQDSIQLDQSDNQQPHNHNQFQFSSVISPKGRRLTKGLNTNTASHQSLAYSNSTYNKNQFTERSPPMFSLDSFSNNQNVNTMNFRPFDRKESTFGSGKGLAIQFDKIKEESYLDDENHKLDQTLSREKIDFPCFLSNQNSPNHNFNFNNHLNDSLNHQQQDALDISQRNSKAQNSKKYKKITPSSRKQIKQSIVKSIKDKVDHKEKNKTNSKQRIQQKPTRSTKLTTISSKQSHEKSTNSLISNEQRRSKSPLEIINKSSSSFYKNPDDISALKQKIKELEYSLQVESISTQQLRTKVSVLNQLLEEKFLQRNGINFKLFKNSSPSIGGTKNVKNSQSKQKSYETQKDTRSYSNIDLYVEMKVMEKAKQEIQIEYERLRNQLAQTNALLNDYATKCQQLQKQLKNSQKNKHQIKTQTSFNSKGQPNPQRLSSKESLESNTLNQVIHQLQEQKQNLFGQIQKQKNQLKQKVDKITQLTNKIKDQEKRSNETQSYVKLFEEKEKRFTQIERPKFIMQIKDLTEKLDNQRENIERLEMENNLIQMQLEQGFFKDSKLQTIQSPEGKFSALQKSKLSNEKFGSPQLSQERCNGLSERSQMSQPKSQGLNSLKQLTSNGQYKNQFEANQQQRQNRGIPDAMTLIMHQEEELKLLKNQRDYFRQENQRFKQMQKDNYRYKVQIQDLRNEVQSLRQIINLDDSCTF